MRMIFTFLSIVYIAGIFLFADSSVVSYLKAFNPYSLLHIPLFGILTVLIIFSFLPLRGEGIHASTPLHVNTFTRVRFLIAGFIALIVAVADEIHQSFIPIRGASATDVFLDFIGILLALFIIMQLHKRSNRSNLTINQRNQRN